MTGCSPSSENPSTRSIGVPVSGFINLANNKPPGAAMNEAASRYFMSTPIAAYPAITDPATLARPPTITANNSDGVIDGM